MRLFISYAHVDRYQVGQLVEVLRDGGYDPWFDHKLMPGQDWKAELLKAIQVCDAFLYALTPESVISEWCQWEFARAVEMGKPIIPVLMQDKTELPDAIRRLQYADFTEGATPKSVARLLGGLRLVTVVLPAQTPMNAPENPGGAPAQAMGAFTPPGMREEPLAQNKTFQPPDLSGILPPPFEWCEIPAGWVTIEDDSESGGTKGGKFHVKRFWMAKYPITNAQYAIFANDEEGYLNPAWWDYSSEAQQWRRENPAPEDTAYIGSYLPRTKVCWFEAVAFCRWLNALLGNDKGDLPGRPYDIGLPTEQEWQRAAQGDDNRVYPWGNEFDPKRCNTYESGIGRPTLVIQYPNGASPYGLMDMSGNVWEWCSTRWGEDSHALSGNHSRVVRGGSFLNLQDFSRAASRYYDHPDNRYDPVGFRVVCRPPSP